MNKLVYQTTNHQSGDEQNELAAEVPEGQPLPKHLNPTKVLRMLTMKS